MRVHELEQRLNQQKNKIGLTGGRLKIKETADAKEPISAFIDPSDWHIEMTFKKDYQPVRDGRAERYARMRDIAQPLEKICGDVLYHECGHWELPRGSGNGCPYDVIHHDRVFESIANVLKRHGKEGLTAYVANAFEDVVVNTNCRQHTDHKGQVLFWNEQGMTHGPFTAFYEAFVRVNLAIWGEVIDRAFLTHWYQKADKTIKASRQALAAFGIHGTRDTQDLKQLVQRLHQKDRWPSMATQFAEAMAPLLDEPQKHSMFGATAQAPGTPGSGEPQGGSAFDKALKSREGEEKVAHARYTAGTGPATNRDSFEQLDALYRKLARDIPVEVETFTHAYTFPLAPYGKEPFDPERHDLLTRKAALGIQDDGTVGLQVNRGWIETQQQYKENIRKFPKFRLALLDTSSSMRSAPDGSNNVGGKNFIPWGDGSKYHYALLGYYGIERFLQSQHIAPYVDSGAINFSAQTLSARGRDARRLLLTPQWGGTTLDVNTLKANIPDKSTFLLTLSDGDIANWNDIREVYKQAITGCQAAHIQIGGQNAFSNDLVSWGVPVYYVQDGKDLTRLMVKIASDKYKSYGRTRK